MFKIIRDGQEIKNPKEKNIGVAADTLSICNEAKYTNHNHETVDLGDSVQKAIDNTILHRPDEKFEFQTLGRVFPATTSVVREKAGTAARRLLAEGKTNLVALNFASGTSPGGGFLGGARAQEEDLCRCSGLYPCLKNKPAFYNENILGDTNYSDNIIYSPNVPFFKDDETFQPLMEPFSLSIITSPAPNLRSPDKVGCLVRDHGLAEVFTRRATRILEVAAAHGHRNVILGAWGCGAFMNDPQMVSDAFKAAMEAVPYFDHICFAVYDDRDPPKNFDHFLKEFGDGNS